MGDLGKYIQKELSSLLQNVERTFPRKCASMHNIRVLVGKAPISVQEKCKFNKSISKIQSVMKMGTKEIESGKKKCVKDIQKNKQKKEVKGKSQYARNLFYQNMLLQEKGMNTQVKTNNKQETAQLYHSLLEQFQQVRIRRLKRQEYLQQLILRSQRMERLIDLKQQNQQKYLKSKMLQNQKSSKKQIQNNYPQQYKYGTRKNKTKSVYTWINKQTVL